MSVGPYLYFQGNCREALEFYKDVFKTEEPIILTYGETPSGGGGMPEDVKKLVLYATMRIAGETVMFSDASPGMTINVGNNVGIIVELETADQVVSVFNALKVGGQVIMEVQETFFSKSYGYVIDKFGVSWQLNYDSQKD